MIVYIAKNTKTKVFKYLNELEESGEANMFMVAPDIVSKFDIDEREAVILLMQWIRTTWTNKK